MVSGTLATRTAIRPQRVSGEDSASRRWKSPGISAISRKIRITPPAIAAGTIVSPAGSGPVKTPVSSSAPLITSVNM